MQEPPMTQQDVSTKCQVEGYYGITKEVISKIERGVRGVSDTELKIIAEILNVSVNWLIKDTDDPKRR